MTRSLGDSEEAKYRPQCGLRTYHPRFTLLVTRDLSDRPIPRKEPSILKIQADFLSPRHYHISPIDFL